MMHSLTDSVNLAVIPLAMLGVLVNICFLWISTRTEERRAVIDNNIVSAFIAAIFTAFQLVSITVVHLVGHKPIPVVLSILETTGLFLNGIFLWSQVILNLFRYLFVRDIFQPQNSNIRGAQSKQCLKVAIGIVSISAIGYGITHYFHYQDNGVPIMLQVLYVTILEIPFVITTCLHIICTGKLCHIISRRQKSVHDEGFVVDSSSIQQQVIHNCLSVFVISSLTFILPWVYVFSVEFMVVHFVIPDASEQPLANGYWITKVLVVVFNPVTFGMHLHPRIRYFLSVIDIRKLSTYLFRPREPGISTVADLRRVSTIMEQSGIIDGCPLSEIEETDSYFEHDTDRLPSHTESLLSNGSCILPSFMQCNESLHLSTTRSSITTRENTTKISMQQSLMSVGSYTSVFGPDEIVKKMSIYSIDGYYQRQQRCSNEHQTTWRGKMRFPPGQLD